MIIERSYRIHFQLYDVFEDEHFVYLVLELASSGELLQYIKEKGPVSEHLGKNFFCSNEFLSSNRLFSFFSIVSVQER